MADPFAALEEQPVVRQDAQAQEDAFNPFENDAPASNSNPVDRSRRNSNSFDDVHQTAAATPAEGACDPFALLS